VSYVFFPGCSLEGTARDFGVSTEAVVRALGLDLPELEDWICCGSTPAHQSDPLLATALPAKNLAAARGRTVAVACAACYNRLKAANHEIAADPATRKKVAEVVGADYDGQTPVKHLLEILVGDLGTARIAKDVVRPLAGLKVVCYYGCLLARPPEVTHFDDAENPTLMDQVMAAAGAEVIDWPHKTECCGGSYSITDVDIVLTLTREVLSMARLAGADCIVTACPLCQINLDMRQKDVADKYGESFNLPVFYFTQLLGLALGLTPKALRLSSLVVDPTALLAARGILPGSGAQAAPALSGKAHT
jgi:heterodisulfide reductase subunit B